MKTKAKMTKRRTRKRRWRMALRMTKRMNRVMSERECDDFMITGVKSKEWV